MKNLVWLASYPRSGNTWLRIFLTNLLEGKRDRPASINQLARAPVFKSSHFLEEALGYDVDCLSEQEIERVMPEVVRWHSKHAGARSFHKIHDILQPEFVLEAHTKLAIYLIRNPLDVCVSFAHFRGQSDYDSTIEALGNPQQKIAFNTSSFPSQFPQFTSSWSRHVASWTEHASFPVLVVRYEDMLAQPMRTFANIVAEIGLEFEATDIEAALALSSFEALKAQEQSEGFSERPHTAKSFFRSGRAGAWSEELTADQMRRLINDHKEQMRRFGYLDSNGNPIPY